MPHISLKCGSFTSEQLKQVRAWARGLEAAAPDDTGAALLCKHRGILIAMARRYISFAEPRGLSVDDLLQAGATALLSAAPRFDSDKGRESTFYAPYVLDGIQKLTQARRATEPHMVDLNGPVADDNGLTLADLLAGNDDTEAEATQRTDLDRQRAAMRAMLASLSDFDKSLLEMFYFEHRNHQEIATLLGFTREAIRTRLNGITGRLRAAHELARMLRRADGHTGRIADPTKGAVQSRKRTAANKERINQE